MFGDDGYLVEHGTVADVDDDGGPAGAFLGGEDAGYGVGVESVGSEAIDGFGREGHGASAAKNFRGVDDVFAGRCEALSGVNGVAHWLASWPAKASRERLRRRLRRRPLWTWSRPREAFSIHAKLREEVSGRVRGGGRCCEGVQACLRRGGGGLRGGARGCGGGRRFFADLRHRRGRSRSS